MKIRVLLLQNDRKKVLIVELFRKGLTLVLIDYIITVVSI